MLAGSRSWCHGGATPMTTRSAPTSPAPAAFRPARAFSLLEVMAALGVAALLTGVVAGVLPAVSHRRLAFQAASDLALLGAALEGYRAEWGDYPRTGDRIHFSGVTGPVPVHSAEAGLHAALSGRVGPLLNPVASRARLAPGAVPTVLGSGSDPATGGTGEADVYVDPWGRPYVYAHRPPSHLAPWGGEGYVLYSCGPDGRHAEPVEGRYDSSHPDNGDNVLAAP